MIVPTHWSVDMRHRVFIRGGYRRNTISEAGGEATGPVFLDQNPAVNSQASTKQYVDSLAENIDAGSFVEGTINGGRIPNFTGDLTKAAGSNEVFITPTGIAPGNFTRVTVNSKGQVTAGTVLTEADLPDLDWDKFADNAPTSLAGYGITDGLNKNNPVMSGTLKVNGPFVNSDDVINKQYVDQNLVSRGRVGEIEFKLTETPPGGYLRCNGGEVAKVTYPALYAVIGDTFATPELRLNGSAQPWANQYQFNETQNGVISGWVTGVTGATPLPIAIASGAVFVTKNRVFIAGGWHSGVGGTASDIIYSAPINADGTIGSWANVGTLPRILSYGFAVIIKDRVHIVGSWETVQTYNAPINADGTLGAWVSGPSLLNNTTYSTSVAVTSTKIYLIGGWDINYNVLNITQSANINPDGTIGDFTLSTSLPGPMTVNQVVITKNRIYTLGGHNGSAYHAVVYTAPIDDNGIIGTWTTGTALPGALGYSQVVTVKNRVYLLGGIDTGGNPVTTVYTAPINTDGTIGTWTTSTALAEAIGYHHVFVTNSKIFIAGGYNGVMSYVNTVRYATFLGGLNDYSSVIEGSVINIADPTKFRLPNVSSPYFGANAYIAYE